MTQTVGLNEYQGVGVGEMQALWDVSVRDGADRYEYVAILRRVDPTTGATHEFSVYEIDVEGCIKYTRSAVTGDDEQVPLSWAHSFRLTAPDGDQLIPNIGAVVTEFTEAGVPLELANFWAERFPDWARVPPDLQPEIAELKRAS